MTSVTATVCLVSLMLCLRAPVGTSDQPLVHMTAKGDISDNAQQGETNIEDAENMAEEALSDPEQAITSEPSESEPKDVNENDAGSGEESSYEADETDPDSGPANDQGSAGSSIGSIPADDITIDLEETDSAAAEVQKAATTAVQQKAAAKTGWRTVGGKDYYYYDDGSIARGVVEIDGEKYLFDKKTGELRSGLVIIESATYYGDSNGKMQKSWQTVDGKEYYFTDESYAEYKEGDEGKRKTGFIYVGDERYYLINRFLHGFNDEDYAVLAKGWNTIDNRVYYMDPDSGAITTGFKTIDGKRFFFNENGSRQFFKEEWRTLDGSRYYFNKDYSVRTGVSTIDDKTYYLHPETGEIQTGWKAIDGRRYYFADERYQQYKDYMKGQMQTGFTKIGKYVYYLITPEMTGYKKADLGSRATGWCTIGGKKYHFKDSGVMDTGWQTIDGAKYHFAANGVMDNAWAVIGGKTYHFTGGKMDTGWKTIVNRTYYFHPNGVKQECGRVTIDGKVCAFGNNGVLSSRNSSISDVVRYAKKWEGKIPYKSSVTGNDKTDERKLELKEGRGSDCSWFVFHCLEKFGYLTEHVHSFEWGSKPSCYKGGKEIGKDLSKARPGDVICYKYGSGKRTPQNSHVSIYIGDGKEIHCAGDTSGKGGVVISKVNKKDIYNIVRFN